MLPHLHSLVLFNTWANHKVVESLKSCAEMPEMGVTLFSHILQNNWYVLDLIEERDATGWYDAADYDFATCVAEIPKIEAAYQKLLAGLTEEQLAYSIRYTDFAGKQVTRRVSDMVFHTFDHCTYHRGQIATLVRQAGGEPAKTWFNRWISETR